MSDNWDNHDDSGDLLGGTSGTTVKFAEVGDTATGIVTAVRKSVDTKPDGTVNTWPNGDPKHVFIISLDDNGEPLTVFCRGNMVKAVREAAAAAGLPTIVGSKLTIKHHALGDKQPGKFAAKLYRAKVEPVAKRAAVDVDSDF